MSKLNKAALLQKNPQVNPEVLREYELKVKEARKLAGKKPEQPVIAPYGGRKLIRDPSKEGRVALGPRRSAF